MHQEFQQAFNQNPILNQPTPAVKELEQYLSDKFRMPKLQVQRVITMTYPDPRLFPKMSITRRYSIMHEILATLKKGGKNYKALYGDIQILKQAYTIYGEQLIIVT